MILQNFPKNCMELRTFGSGVGRVGVPDVLLPKITINFGFLRPGVHH